MTSLPVCDVITSSQISSLKSELEQLRHTRTTPIRAANLTSDPTPLDMTYVKDDNGYHNDESVESDNAFEETELSPITPSPYLNFVPLEAKGNKEQKKESTRVLRKGRRWVSDI